MNPDQEYLSKIPTMYQGHYQKAMTGKSKTAGIKAKCLDCCCWQRIEVANCPATDCPLYPYRPYRMPRNRKTPPVMAGLKDERD
ncbi:MAG: hypothetical protein BWY65_02303 [Firmicutes bacterium ADurb.Bin373]|nr:MAG: hypothetical protein BWY65_02303 [Firmicutes bacterium ADurb.Bin373]